MCPNERKELLMSEEDVEPNIVITPGVDEYPEEVSGEAVDEAEVLGEHVHLADPAAHQDGDL